MEGAYKSPGGKHCFDFIFEGEIRFGPAYYNIKLDGEIIPNRTFGFEFKWHPEAKYLALQEWLTTDYKEGPITTLTLVDMANKKLARVSRADGGFIKPVKFENNHIIFVKEYFDTGKKSEFEINLNEVEGWI